MAAGKWAGRAGCEGEGEGRGLCGSHHPFPAGGPACQSCSGELPFNTALCPAFQTLHLFTVPFKYLDCAFLCMSQAAMIHLQ